MAKTFKKKSFGKEITVEVKLDDRNFPIIFDSGEVIKGIPNEAFRVEGASAKDQNVARLEYRIALKESQASDLMLKVKDIDSEVNALKSKLEEVVTGKKSKATLEAEEKALLKQLEAIQAQKELV